MTTFLIVIMLLVSIFLRFYGLGWGGNFFFHPDERNIASSIAQLRFPDQMNPYFFAYGSFPLYIIYFSGLVINVLIQKLPAPIVSFEQTIFISRFYSAFLSILIILLLYFIMTGLKNKKGAILVVFLSATSVGFVQFAHFGTFEIWLAFLSLLLFYFCLRVAENGNLKYIVFASVTLGLLVSTKVSSLVLFPLPFLAILLHYFFKQPHRRYTCIPTILLCVFFTVLTFLITSPFVSLDPQSFLSSIEYESSVALGTLPVFYTGQFFNTIPILYQFLHVYPFLLNPLVTAIFVPSVLYVLYSTVKKRNTFYLLLSTFYFLLFLSQAFFFAKWTRYMIPAVPFIYLIVAIAITDFSHRLSSHMRYFIFVILLFISALFVFSFVYTVYIKLDTRIEASLWARDNMVKDSKIVSEVFDLGITPFNQYFPHITLFNFYELDNNTTNLQELTALLPQTDYIILPSQRIMKNRLTKSLRFLHGERFYSSLFNGSLGFQKIYETSCDIFCKITYMGHPVFKLEETTNVFDRPTIFIFQKKEQRSTEQHLMLLRQ